MALQVVMGATLSCSFGSAPATLIVLPTNLVNAGYVPAANIMDHKPIVNIPTFGTCSAPTNPTVASATAAASGVLTPMPCVPATASPWIVGAPTVLIANMPALNDTSTCLCTWLGVIQVDDAGQTDVNLP